MILDSQALPVLLTPPLQGRSCPSLLQGQGSVEIFHPFRCVGVPDPAPQPAAPGQGCRSAIHIDRQAGRDADRVGREVAVGLSQGPGNAVGCGAGSPVGIAHRVSGRSDRLGTQQQGQGRESREGPQAG